MPKKAKKGGGGKGGAKTEEERLMYLQQRAQAEEELAKKKEEILTLFLKDKLQKEERNTKLNLLKLNDVWRSILRQTRSEELRRDVTVLSQTFERHLDSLNSVIKNLERDLQEAERQSAQVRRVHLQHVERLWALQEKRLQFVQQQWENGLQRLSSRFNSEREQVLANCQQRRADLDESMLAVAEEHKKVMDDIHRVHSESIASLESAHADRVSKLQRENQLKRVTKDNQEAEESCLRERYALDILLDGNQQLIQKTDTLMRSVKGLQDSTTRLRQKLNSIEKEKELVEKDLKAARKVNQKTLERRDQLTQARTAARKQLTELTIHSDKAAKKLKAVIAQGEKVLRVADVCHRLENSQNRASATLSSSEGPEQQVRQRINSAVLQREALKKHKEDLNRENQQLRLLLRQHLDAMTVSGDAFVGCQALLTVLKAPTATAAPDTSRRHTVIEGVHAVKHSL